jgi:DNA-binding NarL/FixJ family response regulator
MMAQSRPARTASGDRLARAVSFVVALQAVAAVFFIVDAAADIRETGPSPHVVVEAIIAAALLGGVVVGALQVRRMWTEGRRRQAALAVAAGALSEVAAQKFRDWKLTPAEADVAIFALKGLEVAEIAALRGSAAGTVRAQLTRVYEKAGVNSRAGLATLFLEDLMAEPLVPPPT